MSDTRVVQPVPIGIFAKTFAGTTPMQVLTQAREAGYDVVQYNMACSGLSSLPAEVSRSHVDAMRAAIDATGVRIVALSATANLIHPDTQVREAGLQSVAVLAGVAKQVGIPVLTLCSGSRNAADQWAAHADNASAEAWHDLRESVRGALHVAEECGVTLGIEPEPSNVVHSADAARRLLDEMRSDRLGIVFDVANLCDPVVHRTADARHDVMRRAVAVLADRIVLVHAKDRAANGRAVAPGQGVVDLAGCFGALADSSVQVPVIAHGFGGEHAVSASRYVRSCVGG